MLWIFPGYSFLESVYTVLVGCVRLCVFSGLDMCVSVYLYVCMRVRAFGRMPEYIDFSATSNEKKYIQSWK